VGKIWSFFGVLGRFFKGGAAEHSFDIVVLMVPAAARIAAAIAAITPNRTDDEIASAFAKYGVPMVQDIQATPPNQRWHLLLELGVQLLKRDNPGAPDNFLVTAMASAVTGLKAEKQ